MNRKWIKNFKVRCVISTPFFFTLFNSCRYLNHSVFFNDANIIKELFQFLKKLDSSCLFQYGGTDYWLSMSSVTLMCMLPCGRVPFRRQTRISTTTPTMRMTALATRVKAKMPTYLARRPLSVEKTVKGESWPTLS